MVKKPECDSDLVCIHTLGYESMELQLQLPLRLHSAVPTQSEGQRYLT